MKTHPIEAAIGLALIVCWAVATLALSALALIRHLQAPPAAPAAPAPAPAPTTPPVAPEAPAAAPTTIEAQVLQLHAAGASQRSIAARLQTTRSRVRRVLAAAAGVPVGGFPQAAAP